MPLAVPPVRGVVEVDAARIKSLIEDGRFPALPEWLQLPDAKTGAMPTPRDLEGMRWFVSGRLDAPSAAMAVRPRFVFAWMRRALEIEHVAGTRFGVVRLLKQAQIIAAASGMWLTGETQATNFEMMQVAIGLGMQRERARVVWRPGVTWTE